MTDPYERLRLDGRAIIVTGGASGMGEATAQLIAGRGAYVVLADRDEEGGARVADEIRRAGGECTFVATDLAREESIVAMVDLGMDAYGRLDGAFNNGGIAPAVRGELHEMPTEEWHRLIAIDLTSVWPCIKYQAPRMIASGGGSIVNTGSATSVVALPNVSPYVAAKSGVAGVTRAAALDCALRGIRVNAILPGAIDTPMAKRGAQDPKSVASTDSTGIQPMGRLGTASEIAEAAAFLLSDASSFMTGTMVCVDGGWTAR